MNEFKRKLYLRYRNIENMTQLLCLKLYQLRLFIQVNVLLFLKVSFFPFNALFEQVQMIENLSNQLSNSSTNFGLGIKQPEF